MRLKQIKINLKPASKEESCNLINGVYYVKVVATAIKGRANRRLLQVLSRYLNVKTSKLVILKGETDKHKTIGIILE